MARSSQNESRDWSLIDASEIEYIMVDPPTGPAPSEHDGALWLDTAEKRAAISDGESWYEHPDLTHTLMKIRDSGFSEALENE